MKAWILPAAVMLVATGMAAGAEPPHLEFVSGLRARGLSDLAVEYLEKLSKNPPPRLAPTLPLLLAETRLDMARQEPDPGRRDLIYDRARDNFAAFIKTNPSAALAARAKLELGRLVALQGKSQFDRASRQESSTSRLAMALKARARLEEADKLLKEALGRIDSQLAGSDLSAAERRSLGQTKIQAELDVGLALYDQMKTYDETNEIIKRGDIAKKAITALKAVAAGDEKNPLFWEARAWLGRCHGELDDPKEARRELDKIIKASAPQAENGKRLAKFFLLLVLDKDALPTKIKLAEEWLQSYPESINTPEGQGVRFQLAECYYAQATNRPQNQQNIGAALPLFSKAEKLFEGLERANSEYSRQAKEIKRKIIFTRDSERYGGDITKLPTFTSCYLRAQMEIVNLGQEGKNSSASAAPATTRKREDQRQGHFQNIILALNRALDLVDSQTPEDDLADARFILTYAYLMTGDPYRTAVMGEDLARGDATFSQAPTAAAYAIEAYGQILTAEESALGETKESATDRRRARALAAYVERTWPTETAADVARDHLGTMALRQKVFPEAVAAFGRVSSTYGAYPYIQFQLANAALQARKENLAPPAGQPEYADIAMAALKRIPDLTSGADAATTHVYFYGKLELAKMLFAAKDYAAMDTLTDQLHKRFADAPLTDDVKKELSAQVDQLPFYAKLGRADQEFRAGNVAAVRLMVDPLIDQLNQKKLAGVKDPQVLRGLLSLGLWSNIHEGNSKRAKEILGMLQRSASDLEGTASILTDLSRQLRGQIEDLRKKGAPAQEELNKTVASFVLFLDELAKQPADQLTPDLIRFLALSYAGLDKHQEAAGLLAKFPPPATDADPAAEAFYHSIRLLNVRELRLAKQFDIATMAIEEIAKTEWGKNNLEAKKEANYLREDQLEFPAAVRGWLQLMKTLKPHVEKNGKLKDEYFDCYYHYVFCLYQYAAAMTDPAKKLDYIRQAATLIVSLEAAKPDMGGESMKKRYEELLAQKPELKEQYDDLKKKGTK